MQAFIMSRERYSADLPQIFGGSSSLCKLFTCPGSDKAEVCHRFSEGVAPCASFFHVPRVIWCGFATDFRKELDELVAERGVWGFLTCKRLELNLISG